MKRFVVALFVLVVGASFLGAEVSVQGDGEARILSPGGRIWSPIRQGVDRALLLNPAGDLRGDGVPSLGVNPVTREPEAVWARFRGSLEIVFSRFDGRGWTEPVRVGAGFSGNDIRPLLGHDIRGDRVVVWSRAEETLQVHLAVAPLRADGTVAFQAPVRISRPTLPARQPSLVVEGFRALVSFEEERPWGRYVVVMAADLHGYAVSGHRSGGPIVNPFEVGEQACEEPVDREPDDGTTPGSQQGKGLPEKGLGWKLPPMPQPAQGQDPLDPVAPSAPLVHLDHGHAWTDWIAGEWLGWSEIAGNAMSEARYTRIPGGNVEAARREAAREVIGR